MTVQDAYNTLFKAKDAVGEEKGKNMWTRTRGSTKVPRVTILFWVIKVCCTTVGETLSDQVVETAGLGLGVAAAIFYPILFAATLLQMSLTFYNTWMYWLVVILMSVCGTIATDGLHDDLGLALWIEVLIYGSLAAANFALWFWVEGTLAIHSVFTIRREGFYWLTVLWTFALGTAVGDGIAEAWGISLGDIFIFFVCVMALIAVLWLFLRLSGYCARGSVCEIALFWTAYVITRPLGASLGDYLSSDPEEGGQGMDTFYTTLYLLSMIIVCLLICHVTKYDVMPSSETSITSASVDKTGLRSVVSSSPEEREEKMLPEVVDASTVNID